MNFQFIDKKSISDYLDPMFLILRQKGNIRVFNQK